MLQNFLYKSFFLRTILIAFNFINRELKNSIFLLCIKSIIAAFLELVLIIFSGSLALIFLDENKELIKIPKILTLLGINSITNFQIAIIFIIISLTTTIYIFYTNCQSIIISNKISHFIAKNLFNKFINIKYEKYTELTSDKLVLSANYTQSLTKSLLACIDIIKGLISIGILSLGVYFSTQQNGLFIFLFALIIYSLITLCTRNIFLKISVKIRDLELEFFKFLNTCFGGFRDIRFSNLSQYILSTLINQDLGLKKSRTEQYIYMTAPKYILEFIFFLTLGILLAISSLSENRINTSTAEIIIICFAGLRLIPQFQKIFSLYATVKSSSHQMLTLFDFINFCNDNYSVSEYKKLKKYDNLTNSKTIISFENVCYKYSSSKKNVLKNITFSISESEWIAIKGATGSGKSTFLDILLGLLNPTEGSIFYGGILKKIGKNGERDLTNTFSQVAQFPFLFIGDILSNIVGFDINQKNNKILNKCLYYSCLEDDFKNGILTLESKVGERGIQLSGGQRQRIGIARALYIFFKQKSSILVLDECTSALDEYTSKEILRRLSEVKPKITIVLVTHRNDILDSFDKVYKLEKGFFRAV